MARVAVRTAVRTVSVLQPAGTDGFSDSAVRIRFRQWRITIIGSSAVGYCSARLVDPC
jgi:hypothetical protein